MTGTIPSWMFTKNLLLNLAYNDFTNELPLLSYRDAQEFFFTTGALIQQAMLYNNRLSCNIRVANTTSKRKAFVNNTIIIIGNKFDYRIDLPENYISQD